MAVNSTNGLLIMPDISGFTEFLNLVEISHGGHIIGSLLEAMMAETDPRWILSEIEGDALLYYKLGKTPSLEEIRAQVDRWFIAFHSRLELLKRDTYCHCGACNYMGNMTLKVVGHYGEIGVYKVGDHTKLIGKDVVLAHRLLKNSVNIAEYFYVTQALYEAAQDLSIKQTKIKTCEEEYPIFGKVSMVCYSLKELRETIPPAPPREALPPYDQIVGDEIVVSTSFEAAVAFLANPDNQLKWIDGLTVLEYDRQEPAQVGNHHVCVINDQTIHQTLDRVEEIQNEFSMIVRVDPPKWMLKSWYGRQRVLREGDRVKIRMDFTFAYQPILGWVFKYLMLPKLRRSIEYSLPKLQALLENEAVSAA